MCANTLVVLVLCAMPTTTARFVLAHLDSLAIRSNNAQEFVSLAKNAQMKTRLFLIIPNLTSKPF